jgi:hypothetical protein
MGTGSPAVIVTVSGGVADVHTQGDVKTLVVDFDNLEDGDNDELSDVVKDVNEFDAPPDLWGLIVDIKRDLQDEIDGRGDDYKGEMPYLEDEDVDPDDGSDL